MSSSTSLSPTRTSAYGRSTLTQQIELNDGDKTPRSNRVTSNGSPKARSLSDAPRPVLSPSPAFREPTRRVSKDDITLGSPTTPRRPSAHARGLSLTLTPGDLTAASLPQVPLSPKLDSSHTYGSPASMLPRRSRGMDYARACTNLHHSTLAESSPDQSPIAGRGVQIPQRRSLASNTVLDSPSNMAGTPWSAMPERTTLSSSVSSVNMLDSDTDSDSSSDDDMAIDRESEDPVLNTPAASKLNGSYMSGTINSPGLEWMSNQQPSPAQASLMSFHPTMMSFRRARLKKGKSHHSSSSVSMNSSKPSPGPLSPGIVKSVESAGYFSNGLTRQQIKSRRESLSLGAGDLHLSDSEESTPNKSNGGHSHSDADNSGFEGFRGVIKRVVTRRGNLLPKTKGFARIRAALMEEASPLDNELKREAEVIRQVHENDPRMSDDRSPPLAHAPFAFDSAETVVEDNALTQDTSNESKASFSSETFSRHVEKNSAGLGFWNAFDDRYRTPPPGLHRESMSTISDDFMDTPGSSIPDNPTLKHFNRSRSRSTTPLANHAPPTAGDVARRVNNKRRRDEDFDPGYTKRRAVSPGMSAQSSPVIPQSPVLSNEKPWGRPPAKSSAHGDRSNSGSSISGHKKVGLQGMNETNEGIMSMSID